MTLDEKISILRQMRHVAAQKATGGREDAATTQMIRAHQALVAFEAVAQEGVPAQNWSSDIDGRPLDPNHEWNKTGQPYDLKKLLGA